MRIPPKSFCLCRLYLSIFTVLEIKTESVFKNCIHLLILNYNNKPITWSYKYIFIKKGYIFQNWNCVRIEALFYILINLFNIWPHRRQLFLIFASAFSLIICHITARKLHCIVMRKWEWKKYHDENGVDLMDSWQGLGDPKDH